MQAPTLLDQHSNRMHLKLGFFISLLSISTSVSPYPLKIKENYLQVKTQKGSKHFGTRDELSLDRKKRYSPFYSKAYSQVNLPLSDISSFTTSPPTTNKSNELGNNDTPTPWLTWIHFMQISLNNTTLQKKPHSSLNT